MKYTMDFKMKVVKYCETERVGAIKAAKYFGIKDYQIILMWIGKYKEHGVKGLMDFSKIYDGKFKEKVVKYMKKHHLSYRETAIKFNIGGAHTVKKWERIYIEEGRKGLYREREKKKEMKEKKVKKKELGKSKEELMKENERLRIENEYLKKLNALVQKKSKEERKKK